MVVKSNVLTLYARVLEQVFSLGDSEHNVNS